MIYTYNITEATGNEQLIVGKGGQSTKITLITVNKENGAFTFSLILTRGAVITPIYTSSLEAGDKIIDTTEYLIDQTSILSIDATAGVNIVVMGQTSPENAINTPPPVPDA